MRNHCSLTKWENKADYIDCDDLYNRKEKRIICTAKSYVILSLLRVIWSSE